MEVHGAPSENRMPSQVHMGMMNSVFIIVLFSTEKSVCWDHTPRH